MPDQFQPKPAIRLIFEYDDDGVRLISQLPVEMAIAESDDAVRERPYAGYYVDTRDAGDSTLSRTPVEGAFAEHMEVFPEDPQGAVTRADARKRRGAFAVVVPESDLADHVALINVSETPDGPDARALPIDATAAPRISEVARFGLARQR